MDSTLSSSTIPASPSAFSFEPVSPMEDVSLSATASALATALAIAGPGRSGPQTGLNKGAYETRKLLLHLLDRLELGTGGDKVTIGIQRIEESQMEAVVEMVGQLRELVLISTRMGWWVWEDELESARQEDSLQEHAGNQRNSLLPSFFALISRLTLIASQPLQSFSPKQPPFFLQSQILDISIALSKGLKDRHSPQEDVESLSFSLLGGLECWAESMKIRLLNFYRSLLSDNFDTLQTLWEELDHNFARISPSNSNVPALMVEDSEESDFLKIGNRGKPSSYLGGQKLEIYQLTSLVAPVLSNCLAHMTFNRPDAFFCVRELIETIMHRKPDVYLDLLEIVAYGDSKARYSALSIIATFYPRAIGHLTVADDFPRLENRPARTVDVVHGRKRPGDKKGISVATPRRNEFQNRKGSHTFIPWKYGEDQESCMECSRPLSGFALRCSSGHHDPVHLNCLNSQESSLIMHYTTDTGMNRIAAPRFSYVSTIDNYRSTSGTTQTNVFQKESHLFRCVNLFTLVLCCCCHKPLWGTVAQGYKCDNCNLFAHWSCLHSSKIECASFETRPVKDITMEWDAFRQDFLDYHKQMIVDNDEMKNHPYEEMLLLYSYLWIQRCLLENGIASGTLILDQSNLFRLGNTTSLDDFDLHRIVQSCESHLTQSDLHQGTPIQDYLISENISKQDAPSLLFQLDFLSWMTTLSRSPFQRSSVPDDNDEQQDQGTFLETMQISLLQDSLKFYFNLNSPIALNLLVQHLYTSGMFQCIDNECFNKPTPQDICIFPIPHLIDSTPAVRLLILAIDSCLSDADLSVQETGLLLLLDKTWPTSFSSEPALDHLCKIVVKWVLDDVSLFEFARARVDQAVRSFDNQGHSNNSLFERMPTSRGGEYTARRAILLQNLAAKWMKALHDQSPERYTVLLFSHTTSLSTGPRSGIVDSKTQDERVAFADRLLRNLIKLERSGLTFTVFNTLVEQWLDEVVETWKDFSNNDNSPLSFRSLIRLFDSPHRNRMSSYGGEPPNAGNPEPEFGIDAWEIFKSVVTQGEEGLSRGIRWLRVVAQSGADVRLDIFSHVFQLCQENNASFEDYMNLMEALFAASWNRVLDRNALGALISNIYMSQADLIQATFAEGNDEDIEIMAKFLKRSLASFLIASSCSIDTLTQLKLVSGPEAKAYTASRRRQTEPKDQQPITCLPEYLDALTRLVQTDLYAIRAMVGKFLFALTVKSNQVDQRVKIIQQSSQSLAACVFRFFDPNQTELTGIRMDLLRSLLSVDQSTFTQLLDLLCGSPTWEHRYTSLDNIFGILTESAPPSERESEDYSFAVASQYQHLVPAIEYFFRAMWDSEEPIRQKAEILTASLQPPHFDNIAYSIQTKLTTSTNVAEQQKIVAFLIQLRSRLPTWAVLPWSVLLDELFNQEMEVKIAWADGKNEEVEAENLWLDLLILCLQMIGDGVEVDQISTLIKLKYHCARALGFTDFALRPSQETNSFQVTFSTIQGLRERSSLPCLIGLKRLVDSHKLVNLYFETGVVQLSAGAKELVGLTFLDLVPTLVNTGLTLKNLPYLETRNLLEILYITVFKYNLLDPKLKEVGHAVLISVRNISSLLLDTGISYDNHVLIVSLFNCLLRRFPDLIVNILGTLIFTVMEIVAESKVEDGLTTQGKAFLTSSFEKFAGRGLFLLLFKSLPMSEEENIVKSFYSILTGIQNEPKSLETAASLGQLVLTDITRGVFREAKDGTEVIIFHTHIFLDRVYPNNMSQGTIDELGAYFIKLAKYVCEMHGQVNVNPILDASALVIQNHPTKAKPFMVQIEAALRMLLPRFEIKKEPLSRLLTVSQSLSRPLPGLPTANFSMVYLEVIYDSLHGKSRTPSNTLISLIEIMIESSGVLSSGASISLARLQSLSGSNPTNKFLMALCVENQKLLQGCLFYLHSGPQVERYTQSEFQAGVAVGKLIGLLLWLDPSGWNSLLRQPRSDEVLRILNFTCLGVLSFPESSKYLALSLLPHNSTVSDHCSSVLQYCYQLMTDKTQDVTNARSPIVGELLAQAFGNLQLWSLIIRRALEVEGEGEQVERMEKSFGNGVWPDCVKLLQAKLSDGSVLNPIESVVWTSFADLVIFFHQIGSSIVLSSASKWESILRTLPTIIPPMNSTSVRMDPVSAKCQKALAAFENPTSIQVGNSETRMKMLEKSAISELYGAVKLRHQLSTASRY